MVYNNKGSDDSFKLNQLIKTEKELGQYRIKNESISTELATANSENIHLKDKLKTQKEELENLNKTLKIEFENLPNSILQTNSEKFTQTNKKQIDARNMA